MTWWMDFLNSTHAVGSASAAQDTNGEVGNEDELISAPDFLHDNDDENDAETSNFEMEMSDDEADVREEMPYGKGATSALFQVIIASSGLFVRSSLEKWVEKGNDVDHGEINSTIYKLRRSRMFGRALQGKGPRYLSSLTQIAQGYKRDSTVPHMEGCSADRLIIRRKGAWTREEDTLLKRCVETFGEGNWHLVPAIAGLNRCRKSCRLRWTNSLKPAMKRGEFEDDEMDLIFRLHKLLGSRQY